VKVRSSAEYTRLSPVKKLGEGGMGKVYLAEQLSLGGRWLQAALTRIPPGSRRFQTRIAPDGQPGHAHVVRTTTAASARAGPS